MGVRIWKPKTPQEKYYVRVEPQRGGGPLAFICTESGVLVPGTILLYSDGERPVIDLANKEKRKAFENAGVTIVSTEEAPSVGRWHREQCIDTLSKVIVDMHKEIEQG